METETLDSINIITNGTVIKGDITATGDFRLDGILEGSIRNNVHISSSIPDFDSRAPCCLRFCRMAVYQTGQN